MADDDLSDLREFNKQIGGTPYKEPKGSAPVAVPPSSVSPTSASAAPVAPPVRDRPHRGVPVQMARGLGTARALASIPIGIGRAATYFSPKLGELAGEFRTAHPEIGRRLTELEEFADAPRKSMAEETGYYAGLTGAAYLAPGIGLRQFAARATAPIFSRGPWGSFWKPAMPAKAATAVTRAGKVGDVAAKGAVGGAIGNPDDPGTAAVGGALLGQAPGAVASVLNNPTVRWGLTHTIPYATTIALAHRLESSFGIPYHLAYGIVPALSWHGSPANGPIRYHLGRFIDAAGRTVATVPPALMGYFGGQPAGEIAKAGGELADETVGDYARGVAAKTRENFE